ncbi:hypothetical protein HOC01_00845 [archaeon]|nr:hypothetical protein [archaeon]
MLLTEDRIKGILTELGYLSIYDSTFIPPMYGQSVLPDRFLWVAERRINKVRWKGDIPDVIVLLADNEDRDRILNGSNNGLNDLLFRGNLNAFSLDPKTNKTKRLYGWKQKDRQIYQVNPANLVFETNLTKIDMHF